MPHKISRRGLLGVAVGGSLATGLGLTPLLTATADADVNLPLVGPAKGDHLHVMSFNLRTAVDRGARSWKSRLPKVVRLIKREQPTILGTQEGRLHQIRDLKKRLPGYHCVYKGRDKDGTGETTAIFYRFDRVKRLDSGTQWLSDTPNKAGSITWGNKFPRIFTWITFSDRRTGRTFVHLNTHLDNASEHSRRKSAARIRAWVLEQKHPTVITGDFNSTPGSVAHHTLVKGAYHDTWFTADKHLTRSYRTTNGFRPKPRRSDARIDWIIGSKKVHADKIGINTWLPSDGHVASDHWALQALVTIG